MQNIERKTAQKKRDIEIKKARQAKNVARVININDIKSLKLNKLKIA